ncbi:MAG: radical SAM protein [Christensenellaceae bacterium]|nr:radical SAM protein [Christensenellaceae bacterium]
MPLVSRIQRFCPDDGPGVRTTVFFKGCPLSCPWCHNPECILPGKSLYFDEHLCIGCGRCHGQSVLPEGGCPAGALLQDGTPLSPEEIVAEAKKDALYYGKDGGLTLSGGEPLLYPDFLTEVCALAAEAGICVAIDTSLAVPWAHIEKLLPFGPLFLTDLKTADPAVHKALVGADNSLILQNLARLAKSGARYWLSIPVVMGANESQLPAMAKIVQNLPAPPERLRLLPYHNMGIKKEQLYRLAPRGRFGPPTDEQLTEFYRLFGCDAP